MKSAKKKKKEEEEEGTFTYLQGEDTYSLRTKYIRNNNTK